MAFIELIFIFVLGLVFGSFMSVIVFRLDAESRTDKSDLSGARMKGGIVFGRSECRKCMAKLKWHDLIPIFSFLWLRGKCRYCKDKIDFIYPLMELAVAGSFVLYSLVNGLSISVELIYWLAIIFIFLILIFFDYLFYILPDKIILAGIGISLLYMIFFHRELILNSLFTGFGLAAFFGIIFLVSHGEWIGFGDVKLAFLTGFVLGYPLALLATIAAVWAGAIWGLALMARGKANLKTALPFGSFLSAVTILFIIFNDKTSFIFELL